MKKKAYMNYVIPFREAICEFIGVPEGEKENRAERLLNK